MSALPPSGPNTDNPDRSRNAPITRRWWLNLALFLLVVALGVFVWIKSAQPPTDARPTLTSVNPETIQRLEIIQRNQPNIVLEQRDGRWRLTAPIEARASQFIVDSVLQLLRALVEAKLDATTDVARYGLEKPGLTVRLGETVIEFGEIHPLKDSHYVRYGGDIYLVSSRQYAQAARSYTSYIDSRLIEEGRKPVAFKLPGFRLTLKDGTWRREPEDPALSSDSINAFVDDWRHARALKVEPVSTSSPAKEQVLISFDGENAVPAVLTINIATRKPELVLVRTDERLAYHFPTETAQRLLNLHAEAK